MSCWGSGLKADISHDFGRALLLALFLVASFLIITSFVYVLLVGYGFVFFTPEGIVTSSKPFFAYVLLFFWVGFAAQTQAGTAFVFVWIVYVLCFVAAWKWRETFHKAVRGSVSDPFRSVFDNFLLVLPLISSMVLVSVTAIIYSQEFVGIPTGEPAFPQDLPLQGIFVELAYAPVVEELGFRLVPLGFYAILYIFLAGRTSAHRGRLLIYAVLYPDGAKKSVGLRNVAEHGIWRGISVGEWVMIVATSVLFGYAHIMSGTGWQPGKITSVFVQAFFFAVTYLAYGFEAPILLHWYFNYYLFFFDPDVVSKFFPTADPILSVVQLIIVGLGIFGWSMFAVVAFRRIFRKKVRSAEVMPAYPTTSILQSPE